MAFLRTVLGSARTTFPGTRPATWVLRARLVRAALGNRDRLAPMLAAPQGSSLCRQMAGQPDFLGALIWPYQNAGWDTAERLDRISAHHAEIDRLGPPLGFAVTERLVLADLGDIHPGAALVLDQPHWFIREGGLTLNLFVGSFRAYSLSFSFFRHDGALAVYIGGVQGRNDDRALDLYRDLTRAFHGIRPRDLLIECLRMLARHWGVAEIHAVSDAARHHRHPYFGALQGKQTGQDYDLIWQDRGGVPIAGGSHRLPLGAERRAIEDIKPNKRSMYRQRYAFLEALETGMTARLAGLTPVPVVDDDMGVAP